VRWPTGRRAATAAKPYLACAGSPKLIAKWARDDARRLFALSIEALDLTQSLMRDHATIATTTQSCTCRRETAPRAGA